MIVWRRPLPNVQEVDDLYQCGPRLPKAMKSPGITTVTSCHNEEDDDWTEFEESCSCDCHKLGDWSDSPSVEQQWGGPKRETTLQTCFPLVQSSLPVSVESQVNDVGVRFWNKLCSHSVIPNTVGQNSSILLSFRDAVLCPAKSSTTHHHPDLPVDAEPFDWQHKQTEADLVPTFVRPGKPDSPVDINFDHSQAAFGLSQLREADLKQMKWEMSDKFRHLSEVLVRELQERDQLIHGLNVKNNFISALLKVQTLRYQPSEEKLSTAKYLHSVIPFHPPAEGSWSTDMLQQLTKILDAIAQNSDTVPDLVSAYIQSEVLKE